MIKSFLVSLITVASMSSAFAVGGTGGGTVGSDRNSDPNIEQEGNMYTVKRNACLAYGGHVSDNDKRYYICEDGKYDGMITAGPATAASCNIQVSNVKALVGKDGTVANEEQFAKAASLALDACEKGAQNWNSLKVTIKAARKACNESADQGLSSLYRGTCFLKAADLATFILGQ